MYYFNTTSFEFGIVWLNVVTYERRHLHQLTLIRLEYFHYLTLCLGTTPVTCRAPVDLTLSVWLRMPLLSVHVLQVSQVNNLGADNFTTDEIELDVFDKMYKPLLSTQCYLE